MDENRNIARTVMVGLLYPAILGSLVFSFLEIVIPGLSSGAPGGFLQGAPSAVGIKLILFLATVTFYCADYVYSSWVALFRYQFFLLDLIVIGVLYRSVYAINLSSNKPPSFASIVVCFLIILACYVFWDFFEPNKERHTRFYSLMKVWQASSLALLVVLGLVSALRMVRRFHAPSRAVVSAVGDRGLVLVDGVAEEKTSSILILRRTPCFRLTSRFT